MALLRTDFTDNSPMPTDHAVHHNAVAAAINGTAGGTTGQVLTKTSAADFAFTWASAAAGRSATTRTTSRALFR